MRWIFTSLALANTVMLIYFLSADNNQTHTELPIINSARGNLVLLSEREASERKLDEEPGSSRPVTSLATPDTLASDEELCTLIGPFPSLLRAEYFNERLAALDVMANIKELTVSTGSNYWVYLKPEISRKEALRRLSELQKKGIDSYIIPRGNLANGISLGIYTNQTLAVTMRDRTKEMGYAPEIIETPRQQQQIWIFLTTREASVLNEETWLNLLSNEDSLEKRKNICSELLI